MNKTALLAFFALAGCGDRVVDEQYDTNVPYENEVIVNEAREAPVEGDERPR